MNDKKQKAIDDIAAGLDQLFGRSKPSTHGIMFIVTRAGTKLMIDVDPDLTDSDFFDGEYMEDNITNDKDLPDEPGIYSETIEINSYQSNHPLDPIEWDCDVNISNIKFIAKPIDLIK